VVTVVIDSMTFEQPVHVGDLLEVCAHLTWTGRTSMEVEVDVTAENVVEGTRRKTSTAYLVFVALDEHGQPHPVPPLTLETDEDRQRWEDAEHRRDMRLRARSRRQD
jgi:acyl-CoA hydrolase